MLRSVPKSHLIKEISFLTIVSAMAFFVLPISGTRLNNNGALYLQQSDSILRQNSIGFSHIGAGSMRGPVYPLILAAGFKLFGKSVEVASNTTRIFFSLGIILSYIAGRMMYRYWTGILCACLVLSSYGINRVAWYIDTDIVIPFFVLLFVLAYYFTLLRGSRLTAVLAGIVLALCFMIKESTLFCILLPLLTSLFAPSGKRLSYFKLGAYAVGATAVCLLPWAIFAAYHQGSVLAILGVANPAFLSGMAANDGYSSIYIQWVNTFIFDIGDALVHYYRSLNTATPLAPLLIVAWGVVLANGIFRRRVNDLVLGLSVASFFPLIVWVGKLQLRLGQTTMVVFFLYLCLASCVVHGTERIIEWGYSMAGMKRKGG